MRLLPIVATGSGGRAGCGSGCGSGCAAGEAATLPTPQEGPDDVLVRPGGRWSAELFSVPVDEDHHIVYAPLRRAAFVTTTAGRDELAHLAERPATTRIDPALETFLREMEVLDAEPDRPPDDLVTGPSRPTAVTLFLTTACNLRCDYCYASAGDTEQSWMPLAVARRGIDTVVDNAVATGAHGVSVAFHGGGEPTLNWSVLTGAYEHMRRRAEAAGLTYGATLATNGVLPPTRADWIAAHLDAASVSFDGLPEVQDAHRPRVGGAGSSAPLMRTLQRFDEAGFRYTLRLTVTPDLVGRLPESVEFLATRFRPRRIQVEPAYRLGRWSGGPSAETHEFVTAFRAARRRTRPTGIPLFYSAARLGLLTHHFCGLTRDLFALSPDGNVSACYEVFSESQPHAETFFYGQPDQAGGYVLDHDRLDGLRARATTHHDFCSGCFAKWSCAGDCHHKAVSESPDGSRGSQRCHVTRELTKDQILSAITDSGGVRWYGGSDAALDHVDDKLE